MSDAVDEAVAEMCALRESGVSEASVITMLEGMSLLFAFWDEHDASSTISGDMVAQLFPAAAMVWEAEQ